MSPISVTTRLAKAKQILTLNVQYLKPAININCHEAGDIFSSRLITSTSKFLNVLATQKCVGKIRILSNLFANFCHDSWGFISGLSGLIILTLLCFSFLDNNQSSDKTYSMFLLKRRTNKGPASKIFQGIIISGLCGYQEIADVIPFIAFLRPFVTKLYLFSYVIMVIPCCIY